MVISTGVGAGGRGRGRVVIMAVASIAGTPARGRGAPRTGRTEDPTGGATLAAADGELVTGDGSCPIAASGTTKTTGRPRQAASRGGTGRTAAVTRRGGVIGTPTAA